MEDTPINDANEEFDVVKYYMNSFRRLLVRPCHGIFFKTNSISALILIFLP
jgi:hypothetical protein